MTTAASVSDATLEKVRSKFAMPMRSGKTARSKFLCRKT